MILIWMDGGEEGHEKDEWKTICVLEEHGRTVLLTMKLQLVHNLYDDLDGLHAKHS